MIIFANYNTPSIDIFKNLNILPLDKLVLFMASEVCTLKWFESYLTDRLQFVTYDGIQSDINSVKCGVPQGSILGPLLFIIYMNDLFSVS